MATKGSFLLKNGYSIESVIYHSMGTNYIPYIVGFVIRGPKSGTYVIDNFGVQSLCMKIPMVFQQGVSCRVLDAKGNLMLDSECIVRNAAILKGKTNEECAKLYAKSYGHNYVSRDNIENFIKKIAV